MVESTKMDKPLTNLTFEEWIIYVFDRPVDDTRQEWYWDPDADWWRGSSRQIVQFMTQAFENAEVLLAPYSDAQLNQALWYIASNGCSDYMFSLLDQDVPWPARQRCIRSIHNLFETCFAKRCTPHLSHLDEPGAGPLNMSCYMWWDLIPIGPQPNDPDHTELDREILNVMESTLHLDSVACQESALHGFGHWQRYYPQQVTEIIDSFLERQTGLRENLRTYAVSAAHGCVL
jgi:hypothetical protein